MNKNVMGETTTRCSEIMEYSCFLNLSKSISTWDRRLKTYFQEVTCSLAHNIQNWVTLIFVFVLVLLLRRAWGLGWSLGPRWGRALHSWPRVYIPQALNNRMPCQPWHLDGNNCQQFTFSNSCVCTIQRTRGRWGCIPGEVMDRGKIGQARG